MKSILLLSLLLVCVFSAETSVEVEKSNDIIDIVKCFLGKEELINDVKEVIEIVKSGDYSKLLTIAFKVYADVTTAIKECVPQQLSISFPFHPYQIFEECLKKCPGAYGKNARKCWHKCRHFKY